MDDLSHLYQELILDHNRHPHNFGELSDATHTSLGKNPLCGDSLVLYVKVTNDCIEDIKFQGDGCAIFKASTSMMTDALKGRSVDEARNIYDEFHKMLVSESQVDSVLLGKLAAFSGVKEFPIRVKCASLPWHTFDGALKKQSKPVSTE